MNDKVAYEIGDGAFFRIYKSQLKENSSSFFGAQEVFQFVFHCSI